MTKTKSHTLGADAARLAELAALPPLEYDRVRDDEARRLGSRLSNLDVQVRLARQAAGSQVGGGQDSPEYSDDAIALLFARDNVGRILFVPAFGGWLCFDGQKWVRDETLQVKDDVRAHCRQAAMCAQQLASLNHHAATTLASEARISAIERLARSDRRLARSPGNFDVDLWALNTPDGVVDLRTGTMRKRSSEDLFTKVTAVSPGGSCPKWLRFLLQITRGDRAYVRYLQRLVGYTLTGSVTEQNFMFMWGPGGNGKSVFLSTLTSLLLDYAVTAMPNMFTSNRGDEHPTHLAALRGARMVICSEIDEGKAWAEVTLKTLTGGDRISTRVMRGDPFAFDPQMKLWFAGNHRPALRNPGPSMRRRLRLLPLTYVPSRPDPDLLGSLSTELPGILSWAIAGCLEYQKSRLEPPEVVDNATSEYFADHDSIAEWRDDRCEISEFATMPSRPAYHDFKTWIEERGEDPGSEKRFSAELERYFPKQRTKNGRVFLGVRLRPSTTGVW